MFSHQVSALLALIRSEIQRYGQCVVACDRLLVLVSETDPIGIQFGHIFATAEREHWSVEFRNDGMVRFASLEKRAIPRDDHPAGDSVRAAAE